MAKELLFPHENPVTGGWKEMKRLRGGRKGNPRGLSAQLEKAVTPSSGSRPGEPAQSMRQWRPLLQPQVADAADPDVLSHVSMFIDNLKGLKPLPPISLLTVESAREALTTLEKVEGELDKHSRVAGALRHLLNAKDTTDTSEQ